MLFSFSVLIAHLCLISLAGKCVAECLFRFYVVVFSYIFLLIRVISLPGKSVQVSNWENDQSV